MDKLQVELLPQRPSKSDRCNSGPVVSQFFMLASIRFDILGCKFQSLHPTYIAGEGGISLLAVALSQFARCIGPFANFESHPYQASLDYALNAKRIAPA